MEQISYRWTEGGDEAFQRFYLATEAYYSSLVGGEKNRKDFVPYNISQNISIVVIACIAEKAVGCAGLKRYNENDAEVKRVWVEPDHRRSHIASEMMRLLENKARELHFTRTVLQTREAMTAAVSFYEKLGYYRISNYPPYDRLEGAVCYAKEL